MENVINMIIKTPGARNKYAFDAQTGLLKLHKTIPEGLEWPMITDSFRARWAKSFGDFSEDGKGWQKSRVWPARVAD